MERIMSLFRHHLTCVTCNRKLPGAAARCPWCDTSVPSTIDRRSAVRKQQASLETFLLLSEDAGL